MSKQSDSQSPSKNPTTRFLLRMSKNNYDYIKAESQRMNVSMTAYLNFLLDNFINRQKP